MSLIENISSIEGCHITLDADLTTFTTFRLKSIGHLIEIKSVPSLQKLLVLLNSNHEKYLVIGWGANQILPPKYPGFVLHLNFPLQEDILLEQREEYTLPASVGLNLLTSHAMKFGFKGWEVFTGIPASLGGAIYMNAGTNLGEIGSLIKEVQIVGTDGQLRTEIIKPGSFSYRHNHFLKTGEVIAGATIIHMGIDPTVPQKIKEYLEYRKSSQPLTTKNCGCVFKNPYKEMPAGRLIDSLGLKDLQVGNLKVSSKHANFVENRGESSWDEFKSLVNIIKHQMDHFYGIEFELEVKIPYH